MKIRPYLKSRTQSIKAKVKESEKKETKGNSKQALVKAAVKWRIWYHRETKRGLFKIHSKSYYNISNSINRNRSK